MSVVAAKYFPDVGWIIAKNRDCNYKPVIRIRKSFRGGVERLYLWDEKSKYTEGINEYGIGIVSASVAVDGIERPIGKTLSVQDTDPGEVTKRVYYSPDGLRIRTALFQTDVLNVVKRLIELEIPGNTIVADKERCFILEGSFTAEDGSDRYVYKVKEVPKGHIVVRTNHGILLPWNGYSRTVASQTADRNSSEIRYKKVVAALLKANSASEMLAALSEQDDKNPQLNSIRTSSSRNQQKTTGQIMIIPSETTLIYRPIWCQTLFNLDTLNKKEEKTYFEVVSNRKLISFKESLDIRS